eukprot:s472_g18.t1
MRLSEAQQQLTRLSGANRSLQDSLTGCQKDVAELRDSQHAMENSVAGLHASRDSELRLLAEDSRAFKAKFTEEILDAQGVTRSLGHRMSTVEAACAGADRSASSARDEVLAMRTSFRSSLDHVEAAKDELSKELETQGRAVRQAVEKAHLEGHQAACEELHYISEQLQRLTSVERRAKDVARGEEASAQRVAALSEQVERLVRAAQSPSDAGHREVFAELQTAVTRMEELQSQVNRLLRDSKKSTEKWETVLPRLQDTERAVERLSRGPTQMYREMQELRSQLAETRLQASLTPRSDRASKHEHALLKNEQIQSQRDVPILTQKGPGASEAKLFLGAGLSGLKDIAEHCAVLFQIPEGPVLELGSFLLLCEVPTQCALDETGLWLPPEPQRSSEALLLCTGSLLKSVPVCRSQRCMISPERRELRHVLR